MKTGGAKPRSYIHVNQIIKYMSTTTVTRVNVSDLKPDHMVFGNKGNVWSDTAHIYKSGEGNLCGTPALSTNWARIENVQTIGCPECLKRYNA